MYWVVKLKLFHFLDEEKAWAQESLHVENFLISVFLIIHECEIGQQQERALRPIFPFMIVLRRFFDSFLMDLFALATIGS